MAEEPAAHESRARVIHIGTILFVFVAVLTGVVVAGRYFYLLQKERIRESRILILQGTSSIQRHAIESWLAGLREEAESIADAAKPYFPAHGTRPVASDLDEIQRWLTAILSRHGYLSIRLYDAAKPPDTDAHFCRLSVASPTWRGDAQVEKHIQRTLDQRLSGVTDALDRAGSLRVLAFAPVSARGMVVVEADPASTVFRLFRELSGPSTTWESLILFTHHRRVVPLRQPGPPPRDGHVLGEIPPSDAVLAQVLGGKLAHFIARDARGRLVLAHVEPFAQPGWILVGRESVRETDRLAQSFAIPYITAIVALVAVAFAVTAFVWQRHGFRTLQDRLRLESEARKVQQDLAESRALLRTILDTVPQRIFWKDRQSRYLGCNAPFARDAGRQSPDELIGLDDYAMSWVANADLYRSDDRQVMETGIPKLGYEEPQDHPDGTRLYLRTSKVPLRREDGTIYGVLGTYEDITEQVRTRQALEEALARLQEANAELSQLLYLLSHDLRSPLVNIRGFVRELEQALDAISCQLDSAEDAAQALPKVRAMVTEDMREHLRFISQAARSMSRLLDGILSMSRLDRVQFRQVHVDMTALAGRVVAAMKPEAEAKAATIVLEDLPPCIGDPDRLEQVFNNLLSNAIKYLSKDRPGHIRISGNVKENAAVYCVEDNGIGIPEGMQETVFDMFVRAAPEYAAGEGLGLTSVRRIVHRLGGRCWIESTPGQGTKVYFTVPVRHDGISN